MPWHWLALGLLLLGAASCEKKSPDRMLLDAAARNDAKAVFSALKLGANVNGRNGDGDTPLMLALGTSPGKARSEAADALVAAGADICATNNAGNSAFGKLGTTWRGEPNQAFRDFVGLPADSFHAALNQASASQDPALFNRLSKLNLSHCEGIWLALDFNLERPEVFRQVVALLGSKNPVDAMGRTPLLRILLFQYGGEPFRAHADFVGIQQLASVRAYAEDFLRSGSAPNATDRAGQNAIHYLAQTRMTYESGSGFGDAEQQRIVKAAQKDIGAVADLANLLIAKGADPKLKDLQGKTPADLLASTNDADPWSDQLRPLLTK